MFGSEVRGHHKFPTELRRKLVNRTLPYVRVLSITQQACAIFSLVNSVIVMIKAQEEVMYTQSTSRYETTKHLG